MRFEGRGRVCFATGIGVSVQLAAAGSSWSFLSDSNAKTKITTLDPGRILATVVSMPVTEWEYKAVPDRRCIGQMAQDFSAAFGLGSDDKSISTLDSYGVMYVAIQSQVEELKDWNQQMADRDAKIGELEDKSAEIDQLKSELCAICEQISQLPPSR